MGIPKAFRVFFHGAYSDRIILWCQANCENISAIAKVFPRQPDGIGDGLQVWSTSWIEAGVLAVGATEVYQRIVVFAAFAFAKIAIASKDQTTAVFIAPLERVDKNRKINSVNDSRKGSPDRIDPPGVFPLCQFLSGHCFHGAYRRLFSGECQVFFVFLSSRRSLSRSLASAASWP